MCGVEDAQYADVNDIIACFHYLEALGGYPHLIHKFEALSTMCISGRARVFSVAPGPDSTGVESTLPVTIPWQVAPQTTPPIAPFRLKALAPYRVMQTRPLMNTSEPARMLQTRCFGNQRLYPSRSNLCW